MRNVGRLFLEDLKSLRGNVIAVIVVVGLILIPPLYAWFSLLAFWSPYENTGNLQVAVANVDEGYESALMPTRLNAGEEIISSLRANDQFDWVFTTEDEAVEGVKSAKYYAAIVIPKEFSAHLISVFSGEGAGDIEKATIDYYTNQKENAVAPRLTEAGADDLQVEIDRTFTKTVSEVALSTSSNLVSFLNGDGIANYGNALNEQLGEIIDGLLAATSEVQALSSLSQSSEGLARATSAILGNTTSVTSSTGPLLSAAQNGIDEGIQALNASAGLTNQVFDEASAALDALEGSINNALDELGEVPSAAESALDDASADIGGLISAYETIRDDIALIDPASPAISTINQVIASLQSLQASITNAKDDIAQGASEAEAARSEIEGQIAQAKASIDALHDEANSTLQDNSAQLASQLSSVSATVTELSDDLDATSQSMARSSDSLAQNLEGVSASLSGTAAILSQTSSELISARAELQSALASGDLEKVREIIGSNTQTIAQFLSQPTELSRRAVYPMANNGSAMAAFYTSLTLWIGAIFMVALMEADVSRGRRKQLANATPTELYLGRFIMFWLIGFCQATLVILGNVLFLGIQCEHFFLYLLAAWVAALVFDNIVYTLTLSFGKVGEALAIVGLVLQIAGSGGIFPVVMSAPLFQVIYPWLPFSHTMVAFEGCIAGIYGDQYWMSILALLGLLLPSLFLGIVLRRPVIKLNTAVTEKLEETKLL